MNQISGSVTFSGSLGYCQQNAWIQNLSVRENILFGAPFDEDRYWRAVKAAALPSDLELFADGDMTEIGERGVNLSGGQKSRLNIARAFYSDADIILLDDPLSAVDAHIYSMDGGKFVEQGTYNELMRANGAFKKLVQEYGGQREEQWEEDEIEAEKALEVVTKPAVNLKITKKMMGSAAGTGKLEGRLMKGEVRKTGSVSCNNPTVRL
jgi:ATP-binding cassette subfamily C (CFTR/MRP) protein 1